MQIFVQWHYRFIQLNESNYSFCLSFQHGQHLDEIQDAFDFP